MMQRFISTLSPSDYSVAASHDRDAEVTDESESPHYQAIV
jgi:hypothetical protein